MMAARIRVLILGGYGTFGGRLARLLMREPALHILIAGRSAQKAESFLQTLEGAATASAIALDRNGDLDTSFREHRPQVVIDASGPFQNYGVEAYRVVEAAIRSGSHYLDLADDREFVLGIAQFDAAARKAGCFALSGASTCPALTAAVYRHLACSFSSVDSVMGGIAPSPYSGVGPNVIQAIAGYAGQKIPLRRDGTQSPAWPFTEWRRYSIGAAGDLPLRSLKFSLVDVPDLELLADLEPKPASVWFGAAPVPALYHALFRWLARGVKHGIFRSLKPLAPLINFAMNRIAWGEHRGGLFLECRGKNHNGEPHRRSWHLLAEGNTGPRTPTLSCVALIRTLISASPPAAGARPAHLDLELKDFEPLFAELGVRSGERSAPPPVEWPLFRRLLGDAWAYLPKPVADAHNVGSTQLLKGEATVIRGRTIVARAVAAVVGFPLSGDDLSLTVTMTRDGNEERWLRDFSGRRFHSRLSAGHGAWEGLLRERFGLASFGIALVVADNRLQFAMRRWSIAGVPMPLFLLPGSRTFESVRDGRFHFDVNIEFPLIGHIVTYRGWLKPVRV